MNRVLITGAAGKLGRSLRAQLRDIYPVLRLSDKLPLVVERAGEEVDTTDLSDFGAVCKMMDGVDAVVHLGGIVGERDWRSMVEANVTGTYHVFEAARIRGTRRVVYASSNHAIGFYPRDVHLDHTAYPLPDSRYGVSKVLGESLAALYAHKYNVSALCIRIGNFNDAPKEQRHLAIWVSDRDLAQLVRIGIDHPSIQFEVVYGVSGNTQGWWDNRNAFRLGYAPEDNAETHAESVPGEVVGTTEDEVIVQRYQGGRYCVAE